jgi:membrane-associated protease RseP (regulator of RpoE activity)
MPLSLDLAVFLFFIFAVAAFVWRDRRNVKATGLVLMRRTQRGKVWLDKTASRAPQLWGTLSMIGVAVAIPAMIFISYILLSNTISLLSGHVVGAVKLVLPWSGFEEQPGVLLVPWYFWVMGIALVVVPHELFHGIACRLGRIRVKSLGWMLLAIIPGAFVDPDMNQLKKASHFAKLRVFAAGSFANFAVGFLCILIGIALLGALFNQVGIMPSGLIEGTPVAAANLSGTLLAIDDFTINSQDDLVAALRQIPVGSSVIVRTSQGNYTITTAQNPELNQSYLGLAGPYQPAYSLKAGIAASGFGGAVGFLVDLFNWLALISIGIGMFNLLPIKPLDGGLIFEEIVGKFLRKNATRVVTIGLSLLMVASVVFNIVGPVVMQ